MINELSISLTERIHTHTIWFSENLVKVYKDEPRPANELIQFVSWPDIYKKDYKENSQSRELFFVSPSRKSQFQSVFMSNCSGRALIVIKNENNEE